MNMKVCKRLQSGAMVRQSWDTVPGRTPKLGLVLGKQHIKEEHEAKHLGGRKQERYDIIVHWLDGPRRTWEYGTGAGSSPNPEVLQCWELMLVSNNV